MIITLKQLECIRPRACKKGIDRFRELFGESVEITEDACAEYAADFDWTWAATHLLTGTQMAEYLRLHDLAFAEYLRLQARAFARAINAEEHSPQAP